MDTTTTQPRFRRSAPETPRVEVPVVEFRDVTKVYDGGSVGLERATTRIDRGEFVFLVGPTGCGKSTCIRLLMKELEPSRGEYRHRRRRPGPSSLAGGCPSCVATSAWCSRTTSCCRNRTVYDNVAFALEVLGVPREEIGARVPDAPAGGPPPSGQLPDELSGGEQQRVSSRARS